MTSGPPAITFRSATPYDSSQIASLIARVWSKFFSYSVSPADLQVYLATSLSIEQISKDISNPSMIFLVATDEQNIIGIAQLVRGTSEKCLTLPKPIELRRLYLDDRFHGGGIATRLMDDAVETARQEGFQSMWLGVWEDNPRGLRFYEKMGFDAVGDHWFMVGENRRRDWVMERAL